MARIDVAVSPAFEHGSRSQDDILHRAADGMGA
jgi:hypothetical protein